MPRLTEAEYARMGAAPSKPSGRRRAQPDLNGIFAAQLAMVPSIPKPVREHRFDRRDVGCKHCSGIGEVPGLNVPSIQCRQCRGRGLRRVGRMWAFDFAWPGCKFALEIQGGGHVRTPDGKGGRHGRGTGLDDDAEKLSAAACAGWRVLLATGKHVRSGQALKWVEEMFR